MPRLQQKQVSDQSAVISDAITPDHWGNAGQFAASGDTGTMIHVGGDTTLGQAQGNIALCILLPSMGQPLPLSGLL